MKEYDLERFLKAQEYDYDIALSEIKSGRKQSHWIWYIFPQLKVLGHSYNAKFYGIEDSDEAKSYLAHPVLGARLREISQALLQIYTNDPSIVMNGYPDDIKLQSCMTLFAYISENDSVFHKVLDKFFNGYIDKDTLIPLAGEKLSWDSEKWLDKMHLFQQNPDQDAMKPKYRALHLEVWGNTLAIVKNNHYELQGGEKILLRSDDNPRKESTFYDKEFRAKFEPLDALPEISVVFEDSLEFAYKWVNEGLEVSVLNLASRRNPGGGVHSGSGAQEESLFHRSDYYKFLYIFADYAKQYDLKPSQYQYPMDRNFGGIYTPGVIVFRREESQGYELIKNPWQVNMIAVAAISNPDLIEENGEKLIAPYLIEPTKNKIRTIFRIACDHGQRNLVLGAFGCGAFHNPPRHMARLFSEVLCEQEFKGAFSKICFAIKSRVNPENSENYKAFREILDGFVPKYNA